MRGPMTTERTGGSTGRALPLAPINRHDHYLWLWHRSVLRDFVVGAVLLAALGTALSVGPFALELIAFP